MPDKNFSLVPGKRPSNSSINPYDDLQIGNIQLTQAIKKQFPQLDPSEINNLGNFVISEVSRRISEGKPIAFIEEEDGKPVLSLLRLEIEERNPNNKLLNSKKKKGV